MIDFAVIIVTILSTRVTTHGCPTASLIAKKHAPN